MADPKPMKSDFSGASTPLWDQDAIHKAWDEKLGRVAERYTGLRTPAEIKADKDRLGDKYDRVDGEVKDEMKRRYSSIAHEYLRGDILLQKNGGKDMTTQDVTRKIEGLPDSYEMIKAASAWRQGQTSSHLKEIEPQGLSERWKVTPEERKFLQDTRRFDGPTGAKNDYIEKVTEEMDKKLAEKILGGEDLKLSKDDIAGLQLQLAKNEVSPAQFANIYGTTSQYKVPNDLLKDISTPADAPKADPKAAAPAPAPEQKAVTPSAP